MPNPWTIIGWLVLFALVAALAYVALTYVEARQPAPKPEPEPEPKPEEHKPFEPDARAPEAVPS